MLSKKQTKKLNNILKQQRIDTYKKRIEMLERGEVNFDITLNRRLTAKEIKERIEQNKKLIAKELKNDKKRN